MLRIQEALSSACEWQRDSHFDIIVLNSTYVILVLTFHTAQLYIYSDYIS